jgi:hypothetical protein
VLCRGRLADGGQRDPPPACLPTYPPRLTNDEDWMTVSPLWIGSNVCASIKLLFRLSWIMCRRSRVFWLLRIWDSQILIDKSILFSSLSSILLFSVIIFSPQVAAIFFIWVTYKPYVFLSLRYTKTVYRDDILL